MPRAVPRSRSAPRPLASPMASRAADTMCQTFAVRRVPLARASATARRRRPLSACRGQATAQLKPAPHVRRRPADICRRRAAGARAPRSAPTNTTPGAVRHTARGVSLASSVREAHSSGIASPANALRTVSAVAPRSSRRRFSVSRSRGGVLHTRRGPRGLGLASAPDGRVSDPQGSEPSRTARTPRPVRRGAQPRGPPRAFLFARQNFVAERRRWPDGVAAAVRRSPWGVSVHGRTAQSSRARRSDGRARRAPCCPNPTRATPRPGTNTESRARASLLRPSRRGRPRRRSRAARAGAVWAILVVEDREVGTRASHPATRRRLVLYLARVRIANGGGRRPGRRPSPRRLHTHTAVRTRRRLARAAPTAAPFCLSLTL